MSRGGGRWPRTRRFQWISDGRQGRPAQAGPEPLHRPTSRADAAPDHVLGHPRPRHARLQPGRERAFNPAGPRLHTPPDEDRVLSFAGAFRFQERLQGDATVCWLRHASPKWMMSGTALAGASDRPDYAEAKLP